MYSVLSDKACSKQNLRTLKRQTYDQNYGPRALSQVLDPVLRQAHITRYTTGNPPEKVICTEMPILGVGTDILFLPRIASILKRRSTERFARKILCPEEYGRWTLIRTESEQQRFLAVRWCVKEAAYKAIQPNMSLKSWKDLCFLNDPTSPSFKPLLRIVREPVPSVNLYASVSHDGEYVIAMVTAEQG